MSLIAQRPSASALTFTRRARRPRSQGGEFDEEFGDGARGVKLAESAGALQFAQKAFVDLAEYLLVFAAVEVDLRPLQKGIFLPPALFANAHLLLNKLRFAA